MRSPLCATLALTLAIGLAGAASRSAPLPSESDIEGWTRSGDPKVWQASGLYGYIDGGAELFLELGFDRLTVASYLQGDDEIVVELYRMSDPLAALGAYLAHSGPPEPDPGLDLRHTVGRYELQAHRGRYYVKLQNVSGSRQRVPDLLSFARVIARQIPDAVFDDPTAALPEQDRIPGSTRIIRGPLALEPIYSLGPGDILSLEPDRTAVAASYRRGGDRFARVQVDHGSAEAAREALDRLDENLDSYLEELGRAPSRLVFRGYGGDFGTASVRGSRLVVLVGLDERPELDSPSSP
jgi:hypothetical protein